VLQAGVLHGAEPLRVLFIGNSYTYFNNAPEMFAALTRAALPARPVETRMVALPGQTLVSLWERSEAREVLRSSKWDYVVLQDQSQLGDALRGGRFVVNRPTLLHWGARMFDSEIRRAGARTVLLLTWSRRAEPHQQADLDFAYDSVAREVGAALAPVGPVWQRARQENPGLELYAPDGSHPSPIGSYVLACTVLMTLFPEAGGGLPSSVSGHAVSGGGAVDPRGDALLVEVPPALAKRLQTLVRSIVDGVRRTGGYLDAPAPVRPVVPPRAGPEMQADQLAGVWTGALSYFPSPAVLGLTLRFEGRQCQGEIAIRVPDRQQRYEAPLANCALSADALTFSVASLPLPSLIDHFTGRIIDGRLVGTVERGGRELAHDMSGVWSLERSATRQEGAP
jgi:hypothetical protein